MTPTARALKDLKELGFTAGKVEHYSIFTHRTHDLFGWCDIVSCRQGVGVLFIQVTSGYNHSTRVKKIKASETFPGVIASGARVEVWSYSKMGKAGKRKLWTLRREELKQEQAVSKIPRRRCTNAHEEEAAESEEGDGGAPGKEG